MKKRLTIVSRLAGMMLCAAALLTTSCSKDDDDKTQGIKIDGTQQEITSATYYKGSTYIDIDFNINNGYLFIRYPLEKIGTTCEFELSQIGNDFEQPKIETRVTKTNKALGYIYYGALESYMDIVSGNGKVTKSGEIYTVDIDAELTDGKDVELYYKGKLTFKDRL